MLYQYRLGKGYTMRSTLYDDNKGVPVLTRSILFRVYVIFHIHVPRQKYSTYSDTKKRR